MFQGRGLTLVVPGWSPTGRRFARRPMTGSGDQTSDVQLDIGESLDSGFDAEPVIGPRFARTRWHGAGQTV
jgi:hypothetical protein